MLTIKREIYLNIFQLLNKFDDDTKRILKNEIKIEIENEKKINPIDCSSVRVRDFLNFLDILLLLLPPI